MNESVVVGGYRNLVQTCLLVPPRKRLPQKNSATQLALKAVQISTLRLWMLPLRQVMVHLSYLTFSFAVVWESVAVHHKNLAN